MILICLVSSYLTLYLRELLLLQGISLQGLGNWQAIAEHVGTRTKEEVEKHYKEVYLDSPNWPLPVCQLPYTSNNLSNHSLGDSQANGP